jgi:four helix bundle protein
MEEKAYRKRIVWKRAHSMTLAVYKVSGKIPRTEIFGSTSQVHRSAASDAANIAEGYAPGSSANHLRHINLADGCLGETEYHLELAPDLCTLTDGNYVQLCDLTNEAGYPLSVLKTPIERNPHQVPQKP